MVTWQRLLLLTLEETCDIPFAEVVPLLFTDLVVSETSAVDLVEFAACVVDGVADTPFAEAVILRVIGLVECKLCEVALVEAVVIVVESEAVGTLLLVVGDTEFVVTSRVDCI
jgi:hypothetical protein